MDASAIDRLLQEAVEDKVFPGVVAVVGDRDGTLYEGAFGAEPDTMIWIASMTKALVTVAALQLVERGELTLEQPVAEILPSFAALQVLEGFDGDTPRLRPPSRQPTIRQLMTHTGGLGYWFWNANLLRFHEVTGVPDLFSGKLATLTDVPLAGDPGERWEYGTNIDWLGQVIETVTGSDLASYCAEHVFAPLGMSDTTFTPSEEQQARLMPIYARQPDGGLIEAPIKPLEPECFSGGAGAYSTAGDYLRFMRAMLRGGELDGERVLQAGTVDLAFTDHLDGIALPEIMHTAVPELTNDVPSLPVAQGFGLGFHLVLEDLPGMRRAGTGDWAGLCNCYYWIDRSAGVAGTIMTQVLPFFDARIVETLAKLEERAYAEVEALA